MSKLQMIVVPPTDFERDTMGYYCKYKLTKGEVRFDLISSSKGVSLLGEDEALLVESKEDLNVLAKAIAMAWQEHERKKILT